MRRRLAYLPTPFVQAVVLAGDADPRVVVVVDHQPVTLPSFEPGEATPAFTIAREDGTRREYRLADGRLWTPLGEGEGWGLEDAPSMVEEAVRQRVEGGPPHARDMGYLESSIGRVVPEGPAREVMALQDHIVERVVEPVGIERHKALKHVENHMAIIGDRLHHEVPEPALRLDDAPDGGRMSIEVVERRWEDVEAQRRPAFPGPAGKAWLTFPVHQARLVGQVAAFLAPPGRARGEDARSPARVVIHDRSVEACGVPEYVSNGHRVARADAVVALAAGVIGHTDDAAVFAFIELRRALVDIGPDRGAQSLSGLPQTMVDRLVDAMARLASSLDGKVGEGAAAWALRRAAMVSALRDRSEDQAGAAAAA